MSGPSAENWGSVDEPVTVSGAYRHGTDIADGYDNGTNLGLQILTVISNSGSHERPRYYLSVGIRPYRPIVSLLPGGDLEVIGIETSPAVIDLAFGADAARRLAYQLLARADQVDEMQVEAL